MKKHDYILIAGVLLAAVVLLFAFGHFTGGEGAIVEVSVDGKVTGRYSLKEDQTIRIQNSNTLEIKDGKADMTDADCPDGLCVTQKAISKDGESLICLPNKVIVTVVGGEKTDEDIVVN